MRGRPRQIDIAVIRLDGDTQARCGLDEATVENYTEALIKGDEFPPIVVFFDGSHHWLSDGFHRVHASIRAKRSAIAAHVCDGSRDDAAWYALGANRTNGLHMSTHDKVNAIKKALMMRPQSSNRMIAEHVGVSYPTVQKYRAELENIGKIYQCSERETRDGRTYPVARQAPTQEDPPPPPAADDDPPPTVETEDPPPAAEDDDPPPPPAEAADDDPPPTVETPPRARVPEAPEQATSSQVATDRLGHPITDDRIAEAFARDGELVELRTQLSRIKKKVLDACEANDPLYRDITPAQFQADITNCFNMIGHARPYGLCIYCGGEPGLCKACKGRGWVNKLTYQTAPSDLKV